MRDLSDLGRTIAVLQDADLDASSSQEVATQRFLRVLRQRPPLQEQRRAWPVGRGIVAASAVVAAAAAMVFALGLGRQSQMALVNPPLDVGDAVHAPDAPVPLRFSDGSEVRLAVGSEAVARAVGGDGAELELHRGQAKVSVVHRPNTRWLLRAGPYAVRVTGTRFDLGWDPDSKQLKLELWEGSVEVSGPGASTIKMVAPERLVIDDNGRHKVTIPAVEEEAASDVPPVEPEESVGSVEEQSPETPRSRKLKSRAGRTSQKGSASGEASLAGAADVEPGVESIEAATDSSDKVEDWKELARRGEFKAAYASASALGVSALSRTRPAEELLTLSQVCQHSGHGNAARQVLKQLRRRFPGGDEGAFAAYQLGRFTGAGSWFQVYLEERPRGRLAQQALGRLLETVDRNGESARAAKLARRYLRLHPTGSHAPFARRILQKK